MKNIFKTLVPCLVLAVGLTSCYDEMEDKDVVEAGFATFTAPTVSLNNVTVDGYSGFTLTGAVSNLDNVLEVGFMISTDAEFASSTIAAVSEPVASFTLPVTGLKDDMTYYVRTYAHTKGGMAFSEAQTAVLPKAPEFADKYLFGTYEAIDYTTAGAVDYEYQMTVQQKDGLWNKVAITNLWGYGRTITATVDFENKTITTDPYSIIYIDSTYGDVWSWGCYVADGKLVRNSECVTIATYDEEGNITWGYWSAQCSAGSFGQYYTTLKKIVE